ncbi:antibiotic biosynthesis monooxygenase family protein [Deinococcus radiophilus]|uniref:Antibiotic biosynthesis monooxygenase n=1 Tax=Deinococcus radiophilus TaxID=32062 RepID=A0A431VYJ4_9DEIO|nr:antibiotic biosynthesis monooxygenase [Deinococcus radiophilus]RTR28347.1 antibiotic biosynthesis monooxygenase [Deinococcus radiophilus]UFA51214.1 antibiotic biosynthesis monooxygenase [Deinococcus radiophilus]
MHTFKVDKFIVPEGAKAEFLEKVHATHQLLEQQPGFVRQVLLEQHGGPGEFNIVTFVEWDNQDAIDAARQAIHELHQQLNFDPQEMWARLSVRADPATYRELMGWELP